MAESYIKRYVTAVILLNIIAFVVVVVTLLFLGYKLVLGRVITTSITITSLLVVLFVRWAWKWRVFRNWFVPFPNLNGKWQGKIKYIEEGKTKKRDVLVEIKQSFLSIVVSFNTKESQSISCVGSFYIDKKNGIRQLYYSYQNDPETNLREKSPIHYGTAKLDISEDDKELNGEYWTSRKTVGTIILKRALRKRS